MKQKFTGSLGLLATLLIWMGSFCANAQTNMVSYLGDAGADNLQSVFRLSDSTVLVVGKVANLSVFPSGTVRADLTIPQVKNNLDTNLTGINSKDSSGRGVIIHMNKAMDSVLNVVPFPQYTIATISKVRTNTVPGQPTGGLWISGLRNRVVGGNDGYFIAKLNNNFVNGVPTGLTWYHDVRSPQRRSNQTTGPFAAGGGISDIKLFQPWDVQSDEKVILVEGREFSDDWSSLYRLLPDGRTRDTAQYYTEHRLRSSLTDTIQGFPNTRNIGRDFRNMNFKNIPDTLYNFPVTISAPGVTPVVRDTIDKLPTNLLFRRESGIVLKMNRGGSNMRSGDSTGYFLVQNDENGFPGRQGQYPDDVFYTSPCINRFGSSGFSGNCSNAGPGYTGYSYAPNGNNTTTQRVVAVTIDKRNNDLYLGVSTWSQAPNQPNPQDFEPAVVGLRSNGEMRWWARLYKEDQSRSTAMQFVDFLEIDYNSNELLTVARTIGDDIRNFWSGDSITSRPGASSYQNDFTGTQKQDVDIRWMGKLTLNGQLRAATYVGEPVATASVSNASTNPLYEGAQNPNQGNPNLANTVITAVTIAGNGDVVIAGRTDGRTMTTSNAFMKMFSPDKDGTIDSLAGPNSFVRVYSSDFSTVKYSSLLSGIIDPITGGQSGSIRLTGLLANDNSVMVVGSQVGDLNSNLGFQGAPVPTINMPSFGASMPSGESGLLARLVYNCGTAAPAKPTGISGASVQCANSNQTYRITGATPGTRYIWANPGGNTFTIVGANDLDSVVIRALGPGPGGNIRVVALNSCGVSTPAYLTVSPPNVTARASSIFIPTLAHCVSQIRTYKANTSGLNLSTINNFQWTMPDTNWVPVNSQDDPVPGDTITRADSIRVLVKVGARAGFMRVRVNGTCGLSLPTSRNLNLPPSAPGRPDTVIRSGNQTVVCVGNLTLQSRVPTGGATGYNWQLPAGWNITGSATGATIQVTIAPGASGGPVTVNATNACGAGNSYSRIMPTPTPLPAQPQLSTAGSGSSQIVFSTTPKIPGATYQWRRNNSPITNAVDTFYNTGGVFGTYSLVVTTPCGNATSAGIVASIASKVAKGNISVFPNPSEGNFTVEVEGTEPDAIYVTDLLGVRVATLHTQNSTGVTKAEGNLSKLPSGVYFVVVQTGQAKSVRKINKL